MQTNKNKHKQTKTNKQKQTQTNKSRQIIVSAHTTCISRRSTRRSTHRDMIFRHVYTKGNGNVTIRRN